MECIFQVFLFVLRSVANKLFGLHGIFCYSTSNGHWGKKKSQHHHIASPVPNSYNIAMVSALVKAGLESCNM